MVINMDNAVAQNKLNMVRLHAAHGYAQFCFYYKHDDICRLDHIKPPLFNLPPHDNFASLKLKKSNFV